MEIECEIIARPFPNRHDVRPAGRWMVAHTKSRQEKALARFLDASKHPFYLPLVSRTRMARGRKFITHEPLFPGYLFLFGDRDDGFAAISTKRVCQVIEVEDQDGFDFEVTQIARALTAGAELELFPFAVVGGWCRVTKGPFMGVEGRIIERQSMTRLVMHVDILGQGAALEIDADFLEPIE
jgi:transcriptional antiterminator RfaH